MRNLKVFTTDQLPSNMELMATIANGYVGTRILSDAVYVSGLFNGKDITSHRAKIPSTILTNISLSGDFGIDSSRMYSLNVEQGVFCQEIFSHGGSFVIYQRTYAHRQIKGAIITELFIENKTEKTLTFTLNAPGELESPDLNFTTNTVSPDKSLLHGKTKESETLESACTEVSVVWSPGKLSQLFHIKPTKQKEKHIFISAYASSLDSQNPTQTAKEIFDHVLNIWMQDTEALFNLHKMEWKKIWDYGSIVIEGDDELAQAVYGSMYYILSSIRNDWPYGLSPAGLASDGYMGHTFWDQDTWMYPPLLLFHDDLAKSALQYRMNRIQSAKVRAQKFGYKGIMFPWESALTGFEVCPEPDPYSKFEHHVTGDVCFAAQQYWMATHDTEWFLGNGKELIGGIAEFWASRVRLDEKTNLYVIDHVQGPDEYHYDINNSVYTNVIAKINLEFGAEIFTTFGVSFPQDWKTIAEKMYIPFDREKEFHPEFDGYKPTMTVKQADVILLGFPLMYKMTDNVRKRDLMIYEEKTDPNGPAMTKAMFAIGFLEVGHNIEASRTFKEGYANIQKPFNVWTETPQGGEINFITGAGGFLQSVVFGYGGIRLHSNKLMLNLNLPGGTSSIAFQGVKYLGNVFEIKLENSLVFVELKETLPQWKSCILRVDKTGEIHELKKGQKVQFKQGSAVIMHEKPADTKM